MPKYNQPLSPEEKRTLIFALEEMESRGIPVPKQYGDLFRKKELVWPVDKDGYFISRDGRAYNPTKAQDGFITSKAIGQAPASQVAADILIRPGLDQVGVSSQHHAGFVTSGVNVNILNRVRLIVSWSHEDVDDVDDKR